MWHPVVLYFMFSIALEFIQIFHINCSECDSLQNTQWPTPNHRENLLWPTPYLLNKICLTHPMISSPPPTPHINNDRSLNLAHNTEKRSLLHFWPFSLRIFSKTISRTKFKCSGWKGTMLFTQTSYEHLRFATVLFIVAVGATWFPYFKVKREN